MRITISHNRSKAEIIESVDRLFCGCQTLAGHILTPGILPVVCAVGRKC